MPRADGVSALVNSRALELAGITASTPDPEGGRFERDLDGTPTGYVLANAMNVFRELIPPETDDYIKDNLERGLQANAALGWTQTHDAGMAFRQIDLLKEIHAEGNMAHRVYAAALVQEADLMLERGRETTPDHFFDLRGIKVFIDGTLGSRGAALLANYSDADHNGFMNRTTKEQVMPVLAASCGKACKSGPMSLATAPCERCWTGMPKHGMHCRNPNGPAPICDGGWSTPRSFPLPIRRGLWRWGFSLHAAQSWHWRPELRSGPLGPDRLGYAYPWQQLVDRGLMIIGGSDAPVEVGDPRIEFYAAVTRKRLDGTDGPGWHPELAVSRETALKMFTIWPAHGAFQEHLRGSIEAGKLADFTVFDSDLMTIPEADILTARNVMTIVGGKITFQDL